MNVKGWENPKGNGELGKTAHNDIKRAFSFFFINHQ